MSAVSHVLFDRHGYRRMPRHGDPRDAQLHRVLEQGTGCPAALAILYKEVCARLGLHMEATVLDGGRYLVLWPRNFKGLQVDGQAVVIDAYSSGVPILADEVCQIFQVAPSTAAPSGLSQEALQPSTSQEILAALLGVLRDAHWCQAVGCAPEPAFMIPISLETACRGLVGSLPLSYDLQRAIAAAERQALLLPSSGNIYLQLCILLYFAGQYESALIILEVSLDLLWNEDQQLLATFLAKLRLLRHHT
ncbi:hypothetical protein WJX73_007963 [Symbiochloris irregularis]|uniref:Protein SirB1 N-terminal domain-containing protein n=1 Tax=Symbiochloris irregularis TaxID=706552 RepID=A0AAW1NLK6_9CHLO